MTHCGFRVSPRPLVTTPVMRVGGPTSNCRYSFTARAVYVALYARSSHSSRNRLVKTFRDLPKMWSFAQWTHRRLWPGTRPDWTGWTRRRPSSSSRPSLARAVAAGTRAAGLCPVARRRRSLRPARPAAVRPGWRPSGARARAPQARVRSRRSCGRMAGSPRACGTAGSRAAPDADSGVAPTRVRESNSDGIDVLLTNDYIYCSQ